MKIKANTHHIFMLLPLLGMICYLVTFNARNFFTTYHRVFKENNLLLYSSDLKTSYFAAKAFVEGYNPYITDVITNLAVSNGSLSNGVGLYPYVYSPASFLYFSLYLPFDFQTAYIIVFVLNIALILASGVLTFLTMSSLMETVSLRYVYSTLAALLVIFSPAQSSNLFQGNVNFVYTFIFSALVYGIIKESNVKALTIIGLFFCLLKPQFLVLLAGLILASGKNIKILSGKNYAILAFALAFNLLPLLINKNIYEFYSDLLGSDDISNSYHPYGLSLLYQSNQSFHACIMFLKAGLEYGGMRVPSIGLLTPMLFMLTSFSSVVYILLWKRKVNKELVITLSALLFTISFIFYYVSWINYLVIGMPLVLATIPIFISIKRKVLAALVAICLIFVYSPYSFFSGMTPYTHLYELAFNTFLNYIQLFALFGILICLSWLVYELTDKKDAVSDGSVQIAGS